jgi:hypothetical protein
MSIGTTFGSGGQWADNSSLLGLGLPHSPNDPVIGYFVEYEGAAVVPIPAAAWLFVSGLLCLIGISKRNQRNT